MWLFCFVLSFLLLGQAGISYGILCRHENLACLEYKNNDERNKVSKGANFLSLLNFPRNLEPDKPNLIVTEKWRNFPSNISLDFIFNISLVFNFLFIWKGQQTCSKVVLTPQTLFSLSLVKFYFFRNSPPPSCRFSFASVRLFLGSRERLCSLPSPRFPPPSAVVFPLLSITSFLPFPSFSVLNGGAAILPFPDHLDPLWQCFIPSRSIVYVFTVDLKSRSQS